MGPIENLFGLHTSKYNFEEFSRIFGKEETAQINRGTFDLDLNWPIFKCESIDSQTLLVYHDFGSEKN